MRLAVLLLFCGLAISTHAQETEKSWYVESAITGNHTLEHFSPEAGYLGAGVATHFASKRNKHINPIAGISYSYLHFFRGGVHGSPSHSYSNVEVYLHGISAEVGPRFSVGQRHQLFVDVLPALDVYMHRKAPGTISNHLTGERTEIDYGHPRTGVGLQLYVGYACSLGNTELVIRPGYRHMAPFETGHQTARVTHASLALGVRW